MARASSVSPSPVRGDVIKHRLGLPTPWYEGLEFAPVELPQRVRQFTQVFRNSAFITESGRLWVSGVNSNGQLGLGDQDKRDQFTEVALPEPVAQVILAGDYTVVLTESGTLWASGRVLYGKLQTDRMVCTDLLEPALAIAHRLASVRQLTKGRLWSDSWHG